MATIGTTTAPTTGISSAFGYPPNPCLDLNVQTGELWIVYRDQANRAAIYKSSNNGTSWTFMANFTAAGYTIEDVCAMRVDSAGNAMHVIMLANDGTSECGIYKRIPISSGSPDVSTGTGKFTGPSGTNQSFEYTGALVPVVNPDGSTHVFIAFAQRGTYCGITVYAMTVRADATATTFVNNAIIGPTRTYKVSSSDSCTVSVDVEHNGDGITSSTPNVWAAWLVDTTTYCIRATWKGYKSGWQTPSAANVAGWSSMSERDNPAVWDGQRYLIIRPGPGALSQMQIIERKADNSANAALRLTPVHPQGTLTGAKAVSYNYVTKDARVYAIGGSGTNIYYIDYFRASNSFGSWTDTGLNPVGSEWGMRRGTYGTAQYDMYYETGTATPWTVSNLIQALNFAPTAPTWVTGVAGTVSQSGAAFDVSVSLTLDWVYHDPNTTDSQAQYAVSRQIGGAAVQWWRASDSTWQTSETYNASGSTLLTLTTAQWLGSGGAADPAHIYKVATKDSGGLTSAYSSALAVVPSTRVDPTLTAPTTGAVLNAGLLNVTWTVSEQSAYRIVVVNTATGATAYDSGFLSDPTPNSPSVLAYTVPTTLPNGFAGTVSLTAKNAEGLAGTTRTASFSIVFTEPATATVATLAAVPASGGINVTVTQPAASGSQPATTSIDLWHRVSAAGTLLPKNTNPYFETDASDWTSSGYSTIARSTAQAHSGVGSLLCTPNGSAAAPKAQTTALYPVTAGLTYEFRGWVRATTVNKTVRVYIDWYDNTPALLSSTTRDYTPVAGVWLYMWVQGSAPAGATQARIAVGELATPAAGDTIYADELQLMLANTDAGIRVAADITAGTPVLDWRTVTGVDYEWRAYAESATNGTFGWGRWAN